MRLILADSPLVAPTLPDLWIPYFDTGSFAIAPYILKGYDSIDKWVIGAGGGGGGGGDGRYSGLGTNYTQMHGGGAGGGGGGGGFKSELGKVLSTLAATNAVTIGSGGTAGTGAFSGTITAGGVGGNSTFDGLTAYGGGGGGKGTTATTSVVGYGGSGGAGGGSTAVGANGADGTSGGTAGSAGANGGGSSGYGGGTSPHIGGSGADSTGSTTAFGGAGGGGGASGSLYNVPWQLNNQFALYHGGIGGHGYLSLGGNSYSPGAIVNTVGADWMCGGGNGCGGGGTDLQALLQQYFFDIGKGGGKSAGLTVGGGGSGGYGGYDNAGSSPIRGQNGFVGGKGGVLLRVYKA